MSQNISIFINLYLSIYLSIYLFIYVCIYLSILFTFQGTLQSNSSKLSTTVKFPLTGFDISEHVAAKPHHTHPNGPADSGMLGGVWSPWKRPKRCVTYPEENVYDLYGVCYHHGKDMQGGHYTGEGMVGGAGEGGLGMAIDT